MKEIDTQNHPISQKSTRFEPLHILWFRSDYSWLKMEVDVGSAIPTIQLGSLGSTTGDGLGVASLVITKWEGAHHKVLTCRCCELQKDHGT